MPHDNDIKWGCCWKRGMLPETPGVCLCVCVQMCVLQRVCAGRAVFVNTQRALRNNRCTFWSRGGLCTPCGVKDLPSSYEVLEVSGNVALGVMNCFSEEWFQKKKKTLTRVKRMRKGNFMKQLYDLSSSQQAKLPGYRSYFYCQVSPSCERKAPSHHPSNHFYF